MAAASRAAYRALVIDVVEIGEVDLPRLVASRTAVAARDIVSASGFADWRRQCEDMAWFVAVADGRDVGGAFAHVGWHSEPGVGFAEAWTLPDARGRGVGKALFEAVLRWVSDRGCIAMDTRVMEDDPSSLAWAERRGFRRIGATAFRTLDLRTAPDLPVDPPAGVAIATWAERPGIERALYEVFCEARRDIPGEEGVELPSFERWLAHDMEGSSDRPDAVFVALAGDEVLGYAKLSFGDDHHGTAWHDLVAVRRDSRGRGIGGALKRAQIAWAKAQGFERLSTRNEERNEPIRRLNAGLGYALEPGHVVLRTMLASPD